MKIQTKILLIIFSIILITGIIIIIIAKQVSSNIIKEQIYNQLETTTKSRANHINTYLTKKKESIKQLSESIVVEKLLLANRYDKDYKQKFNDVMRRLKYSKIVFKDVYGVFILDRNGIIIASSNKSDIGKDKSSDSYFLGGKLGAFIKDAYFSKAIKANCLAFSAPVFDKQNNKFLGVVVNRCSLEPLNIITQDRIGLGKTGEIYLVNKDNHMITPSRFIDDTFLKYKIDTPESREWLELSEQEEEIEREERDIYTSYYGKEVIGTHYKIEGINWCLLTEISEKEAFASAARLTQIMLLILAILLAMGIITSVFISRTFTAPILKLHKGAEAIMKENLNYKVGTKAKDEIGQLSRTFDKMTSNLKKSREELKEYSKSLEKKVKERTAELKKQLEKSEQQRIGTLNILRDLEQAHESLKAETKERKLAERIQRTLYKIANAVNTTTSLDELYKLIHRQLGTIVDTTNFYVALYDEKSNIITAPYYADQLKKNTPPPQQLRNGLTGYVIHTAKPLYLTVEKREKLMKEGKIAQTDWKSKIWIGVPLRIENKVIGALAVQSYTNASLYTKKDMEILEFVSDAITLAINRKTAEEKLQKHLRELEIFHEATMGREGRIIELKHKINELLEELGRKKKYMV